MSAATAERPKLHERLKARFASNVEHEADPLAAAEREAIQTEPSLASYRQSLRHDAMVAGLLAGARRCA